MDNLRLVLIITGIFIIAAIYIWDQVQSRRRVRKQRRGSIINLQDEPDMVMSGKPATDEDYASELANLNSFMTDSKSEADDDVSAEAIVITRDSSVQSGKGWGRDAGAEIPDLFSQPYEPDEISRQATEGGEPDEVAPESVIALYIVASEEAILKGREINTALASLGFRFGEMDIFHHYGIGQLKSVKPLFSLVNMYEPGNFDINAIDQLSTRGLSVFMCLPGVHSSDVVFSYMLEIARRLADKLDATLLGPDRREISQKTLDSIAVQIKKYG